VGPPDQRRDGAVQERRPLPHLRERAGPGRAGFGDAKYDRLVEIKRKYDPDNVFRFNQNIKP